MTNIMLPYGAGSVTPESDNAPWQARVEGEQGGGDNSDCADSCTYRKRLATLQARLALLGIELHELKTGTLLAAGVGLVVHFSDLEAVKWWAREVAP